MDFNQLFDLFELELEVWPPTIEAFDYYLGNFLLQHASSGLTERQKSALRESFQQAAARAAGRGRPSR